MNIWNILGIEPTADKKIIKKAYAAKTREIHPEERPEEFKQLHEAYQAALGYATFVSTGNPFPDGVMITGTTEESGTEKTEEIVDEDIDESIAADAHEENTADEEIGQAEGELLSFLADNQEKHQKHVDAFTAYWKEFRGPYRNPEVLDWWKEYLHSEAFQEIRYHPQVLHLLAEEIDNKFVYGIDEVKMLFWDAYGFQEDEEAVYQGDQQRLWKSLYPAYVKQQRILQNEGQVAKYEKFIRIFAVVAVVVIAVVCVVTFVGVRRRREEGLQYLVNYMKEKYEDTSFSAPEQSEKLNDGSIIYTMHSQAHPELPITAKLEDTYVEGVRTFLVKEDYDKLLLEYYAAQYGLEAGRVTYNEGMYGSEMETEYSLLFYGDIGQIDDFCEKVERMFREQEELQKVSETAVCTDWVVFPEILLQGGVEHFPFAEDQIYDLRVMDASELSALLRENYMVYMFQYESWNITPEQYREWGAAYEKLCEQWVDDDGEWHEVYDPETGEYLCRLFIFTYQYVDGSYSMGGISTPSYERAVTVGNAYYYLQDRGADLTEYDTGFQVEFYGSVKDFGRDPEEPFYDLRNWY